MSRVTVYAVRNAETKARLSYRWRDKKTAIAAMRFMASRGGTGMEVYRTTQDLVRV